MTKQSKLRQKLQAFIKELFWRAPKARKMLSFIFITLLFCFSMAMPRVVAQQEALQQSPAQLVQEGKEYYDAKKFTQALEKLQQAARIYEAQGNRINQAITLSNLSLAYRQLGQWNEAKRVINESLMLLEAQPKTQERSPILAQTLNLLGRTQRELGQPEEALRTWQQATKIYNQIKNQDGAALSQINQALALQDLGLYPRACNTLLATLELNILDCQEFRKLTQEQLEEKLNKFSQEQPPSLLTVRGLRNLSDVLGVGEQAIHSALALQASLNLANQLDPSPDKNEEIAAIYLRVGNIASALNNTQAALEAYKQADTESAKVTTRIQSRLNQLSLLVRTREWSEVKSLRSKIDSELKGLPPSRTAVKARINLAQSLSCFKESTMSDEERKRSSPILQQCILAGEEERNIEENTLSVSEVPNWEEIAKIVAAADKQAKTLGNKRLEADALGYLGGVSQQMGNFPKAQDLTEQALELAPAFEAPEIAYRWQWQLGRLRQIQGDQQGAITAYTLAFETLNSLRADLVATNPEIQLTFRESVEPVARELVALLLQQENPSQDNLILARKAIEELRLAELNDLFRDACLETKPEQIDKVVAQAKSPTAFLYTIILQDRIEVILALSGEKELKHYPTEIPQNEVKKTLANLRDNLSIPTWGSQVQELSQKVYDWLIRPVEAQLAESEIKTLVFVLDGPLSNIPMAVLYDGEKYLVEKYALAVNLGLQLLNPQPLESIGLNALIAGLTEERRFAGLFFPALTNVRYELEEIKSILPSVELIDEDFTASQLKSVIESGKFAIVHLATHANFSSDPNNSFILLKDRALKPNDLEKILRAVDPYQSKPIDLLVFSSGQTIAGDNLAVLGLAGVAARAGVRSVLGTLWSVNDEYNAKFMGRFYKNLIEGNMTKAEALRQAQRDFLLNGESENSLWQLPYFWATYILLGNWL